MTLKQLEYFLAIAESGNITKAAARLNISQPPLSLQLKTLEDELGVELFVREKKKLFITSQGQMLEEYARKILAMSEKMIQDIQAQDSVPKIRLRVATISSVCNQILPDVIHRFKEYYPYVEFEIFETDTLSVIEKLSSHTAEFGFVREPFNNALYNTLPINDSTLGDNSIDYFCALAYKKYFDDSEAETISLQSLKNKPIIIHRRHYDIFVHACKKAGFSPYIVCQNDNIWSAIRMAESDIGLNLAPYTAVILNTNPDLIIKRVDYPCLVTRTYLTWNRDLAMTKEVSAFLELFSKQ